MSFVLGLAVCAAALALIILSGVDPSMLFSWKALVFVAAGIIGLTLITSPLTSLFKQFAWAAKTIRRPADPGVLIDKIMELVRLARKDGILALESKEAEVADPYLKKGLALITGSADRESIESILSDDSAFESSMEKSSHDFVEKIAVMTPVIGMLGTLVEIVQMFYTYKGPSTLAPGIANALLPAVYSGLIAYLFIMPLVSRIKSGAQKHRLQRELAIKGVLAIQSGETPFIVRESLSRYAVGRQQSGIDENE